MYNGLTVISSAPYSLQAASGNVYTSGATLFGSFNTLANTLVTSGTTLYSALPAAGAIGPMSSAGVTGAIALPAAISLVNALTISTGTKLAVGGQSNFTLSGASFYAFDTATNTQMLGVGSGRAIVWSQPSLTNTDAWTQTQVLTSGVSPNLGFAAWLPNGTQVLASDGASGGGVVQVFNYAASTLSLSQTLTVNNASAIAVFSSNSDALVCRSTANVVVPLYVSGGSWFVSGTTLSLTAPGAIVTLGSGVAAVGYASGVAVVTQTAGIWNVTATGTTNLLPTTMTTDFYGNLFLAGSGGAFAVVSSGTLSVLCSGAVSGTPTASAWSQGRWLLAVPAVSGVYTLGLSAPQTWTQQGFSASVSGTPAGIAVGGTTIFTGSVSGGTALLSLSGSPYALTPVQQGYLGLWGGSSWTTASLGAGVVPTALAFDASGNVNLTCVNNTLYSFSSSGVAGCL